MPDFIESQIIEQSAVDGPRSAVLVPDASASSIQNRNSKIENRRPSPLSTVPSLLVRLATLADLPAIDALQKKHSKQLGFFPRAQMEGKIRLGHVLVAVDRHEGTEARRHEGNKSGSHGGTQAPRREGNNESNASTPSPSVPSSLRASVPLGYLISTDRYLKRDELGVVYQLCVSEEARRKFVAATLLRAVFERASYGCRLFCCWCAQDLAANRFWESMGFVPLAFRSGSRKKDRVHIFWQKRIRAGDDGDASKGGTPWWFPSQTGGGSIREDRIVLPIPPGVRWSDEMPRVYPGNKCPVASGEGSENAGRCLSSSLTTDHSSPTTPTARRSDDSPRLTVRTGLHFIGTKAKPVKVKKPAPKFEAEQIAMSRQLRDRWLEEVNADPTALLPAGRYDLVRELAFEPVEIIAPPEIALLPAPVLPSVAA